ncbi:MAG: sodium:calcium antiporter [Chloroflexota bacterium]
MTIALLLVTMAGMIVAAELFTNSVEWLGDRLRLGDGAVGSVLAAVGTALPETLVPIVAIVKGGDGAQTVSVGAILGAPFMLATLALFLSGSAVLLFRGVRHSNIEADARGIRGDLSWFLLIFAALLGGTALPSGAPRVALAVLLLGAYTVYVRRTVSASAHEPAEMRRLYLGGKSPRLLMIYLQLALALGLLIACAHWFVAAVEGLAEQIQVPLLVLSLLLIPLATELPEKVNSILWLARRKDTLALGNITGALVFQAAIPGAVGLLFTDWTLSPSSWLTAVFTLTSAGLVWCWLRFLRRLPALALLPGGAFYLVYVGLVLG